MAIYSGRILMRRGLEADFDAEKLMAGEWALSTDKGIVRICLEEGKVIRMATYERFEEDMKQIEAILLECQTIEEAVQRINTEINEKVDAVVEYVGQAKTYRDEALQFRNEAEAFKNQAGEIAGIDIATTEKAGIVKPDGTTITVDADGTIHSVGGSGGTSSYNDLTNKPKINGVELVGDVSTDDLNINTGSSDYVDLTNKPSINGIELSGNVELDLGTNDYIELQNKPKINGVELSGDLSSSDLNLEPSGGVVDVVDNLLSTSTTLPLSANQGRILDEKISTVNESLGGFEFYTDEQGKAYYKPMGADSGIPFSSIPNIANLSYTITNTNSYAELTFENNVNVYCVTWGINMYGSAEATSLSVSTDGTSWESTPIISTTKGNDCVTILNARGIKKLRIYSNGMNSNFYVRGICGEVC